MPAPVPIRVNWRIVVGITGALTLLFTFQNSLRDDQPLGRTFGLQVIVWMTWLLLSPLIFAAARRWRANPRFTVAIVTGQVLTAIGVALLHSLIAGTTRFYLGWTTNQELIEVILIAMSINLASNFFRYAVISTAYHALAYHHEVRDRDVRAARLEGSLVQAQLESLQCRLHPHFLFNTLNSIGALIRDQPAAAEQMLGSLSELLRASLNAEPSREVTLERELDLLRQYVSIQQMRFQDRLTVTIEAAPDVLPAFVPHLVLQPLVENAIRHGIAPRESAGHVRVAAGRSGDRLRLIVEDNGLGVAAMDASIPPADVRPDGSGFGLSGTRARLQHLYGDHATFDLQPRTPTGTVATIVLPFHTSPVSRGPAAS